MARSRVDVASLSAELRARTSGLHAQIEILLGLPGPIRTQGGYLACLSRFLGFYEPLELSLATFTEWGAFGVALPRRTHSADLADDLAALDIDPDGVARASQALLPELPTFAHALGAFYVIEGATLGGRLILAELQRLGCAPIAGATHFFGGRGNAVAPTWQSVKAALDRFGRNRPELSGDVVTGAERSFRAMLAWFTLRGADAAKHA
jgi:heme oxygenase